MRPYEVMVILDADLEDDAIAALLDKAAQSLTSEGGVVNRLDHWGRRTLAYEIRHKRQGYYALFELTAEPPAVAAMDRVLHLADEVIRHKVIRIPPAAAGRKRPAKVAAEPEGASTTEEA